MDNCGGQNKNGTVLKLAAYFAECEWFEKVNFVFLIKGHTKNACDRMFNLLKIKWHNLNVCSLKQALDVLNTVESVNAIEASNIHLNYSTTFNW